jgi:hypothetical protein
MPKIPSSSSRAVKSVFFGCIDPRLVESHCKFVGEIGGAYFPSMGGGGLALIDPEQREVALNQIVIPYKIGQIDHVYLESHLECQAYAQAGIDFNSQEDEINRLKADLENAKKGVQAALVRAGAKPDEVVVTTRVVDHGGDLVKTN